MPLALLMSAVLLQAPGPPPRPWVACTLEIRGSLNSRRAVPRGTETVSETFQYALPGWIQELEGPSGEVLFEFSPSKAPERPSGILNRHTMLRGKGVHESSQFYGSEFREGCLFRFESHLRGQNLFPVGNLTLTGNATSETPSGSRNEKQTVQTSPFPKIRRGPSDFAAPTLRFTLSSLWKLHKASSPFAAEAFVTYANNAGGASYAGRVDIRFRLDPRNRSEHP